MKKHITLSLWLVLIISQSAYNQIVTSSNWKVADTTLFNSNDTAKVWRSGSVAISSFIRNPFQNMFLVTKPYQNRNSRTGYFGMNEPDWENQDTTKIGLATHPLSNYQGVIMNHYANFTSGVTFTDPHISTLECNFNRGTADSLGFKDGGQLTNAYTARFSGGFSNNNRAYKTENFDILNLRLFTGSDINSLAEITNFYGIRLDYLRGVNPQIIKNGWGIYISPNILKNYFAGYVGIGTTSVTNALTVSATSNPLKINGLQNASDNKTLTIDDTGVVHTQSVGTKSFEITYSNTTVSQAVQVYVHKGGNAAFTLPSPSSCAGQVWTIINVGTGKITLSQPYYEATSLRNDIMNVAGAYSREIMSDGTAFIALK